MWYRLLISSSFKSMANKMMHWISVQCTHTYLNRWNTHKMATDVEHFYSWKLWGNFDGHPYHHCTPWFSSFRECAPKRRGNEETRKSRKWSRYIKIMPMNFIPITNLFIAIIISESTKNFHASAAILNEFSFGILVFPYFSIEIVNFGWNAFTKFG